MYKDIMAVDSEIIALLDAEAASMNVPEFIEDDPVQFPRRFADKRDIEIVSLLVSSIAWGNRRMILKSSEKLLGLLEYQPYKFVMERGYEELPHRQNIHRTFFTDNLKHYLRGLNTVYTECGSLEDLMIKEGANNSEFPAWKLAEAINIRLHRANGEKGDSRCLPLNTDTSALKRLNMALRWLVRDDGIVDLGVWSALKPSRLFIPLDVHVGRISRRLDLLGRSSNDKKAVVELTEVLREIRPDDPVYYDFALFGIGVHKVKEFKQNNQDI